MVTDSDEVDRDVDSTFKPSDPSSSGWISVFHLDNVSRYGHDMVMKVMISQLKAKLSAYYNGPQKRDRVLRWIRPVKIH